MQTVATIGLDIAKSVFQVHGVDAEGKVLIRRKLQRRYVLAFFERLPPCLVVGRANSRTSGAADFSGGAKRRIGKIKERRPKPTPFTGERENRLARG